MRAPFGQKVPVPPLFCSGTGSAKVTDDGAAPAIAAIAPAFDSITRTSRPSEAPDTAAT
jgi:hypothetical protein